jgi:hypothetical protein
MSAPGQDTDIAEVAIRVAERTDVPYIFRRSLSDLRNCPAFAGCGNGLYHQYMHRALEHTLMRAITFVAYPAPQKIIVKGQSMVRSSDSRRILGFVVADPTDLGLIVHTMNVRRSYDDDGKMTEDYRRLGIGKKMLEAMMREYKLPTRKVIYTLKTSMFRYDREFKEKLKSNSDITFNPFLFWTLLPEAWETGIRKPSQQYMHEIAG